MSSVRLPENLREQLKIPLGDLLPDAETSKENILENITSNSFIITVGDATTEKLVNFGITPSLQIVDGQEKRAKRTFSVSVGIKTELSCENPAGEITAQSIDIIKQAMGANTPVRITVNGEEDLLVIPVCIHAPENSVVMYGQPNQGLVIVKITQKVRDNTQKILDSMS